MSALGEFNGNLRGVRLMLFGLATRKDASYV